MPPSHNIVFFIIQANGGYRGIYVPRDNKYPLHFQGMGIRIEDSVCVDETSPVILSVNAAKEVADIEALAAEE